MAAIIVNGHHIEYEESGSGPPLILTPGGRWGRDYMRPLAERMSARYRVFIYDRTNCGMSDLVFNGEGSEAEIWADDLAAMITQLGIAPAFVGEYAGGRTSLLMAMRHPQLVGALLLGWPAGGPVAAERLGNGFYGE